MGVTRYTHSAERMLAAVKEDSTAATWVNGSQRASIAANGHAMIETVENNMVGYTKREIAGADKARLLLGKMGFPSVQDAIDIATRGTYFDVTARDFALYGADIASLKGKTRKMARAIRDILTGAATMQVEQILSVDVMFAEGVPSLIGLATPLDLTIAVTLSSYDSAQGSRWACSRGRIRVRRIRVKTVCFGKLLG